MTEDKQKDAPAAPHPEDAKKYLETPERAIVLGKVKTDEEARLAAEIEKLRG